ncbi:MAG: tyrosine-type recombinase/integrase [Actinomycetota bacterium]|nr:tyrosine-type recombinase/integrase [Actinomycetota bacterium]
MFGRTAFDPFTDTHMRKRAQKAWTAAGLAKIGFHECRHSFSSMLSAAGVDQTRADWYLGHADHSTPGRYRHPLPGQLAKDAETLEAYLAGAGSGKVVPIRTGAHTGAHEPQTRTAAGK